MMSLKTVLVALSIGLGCVVLLVFLVQRNILFPRHVAPKVPTPPMLPSNTEQIWLADDDVQVEAWFMKGHGRTPNSPGPLVIFAHGNAEVIDYAADAFQPYLKRGISVALLEYRGYGRSEGSPSEASIVRDGVALYDHLVDRAEVNPKQIIFHGRSLGGGVVCGIARQRQPLALILESTFTSVRERAAEMWIPGFLIRDPFDNLSVVSELSIPILIMHGRHDEIVSVEHGETLAATAVASELHIWPTGHNDLAGDQRRYWTTIYNFLDRLTED